MAESSSTGKIAIALAAAWLGWGFDVFDAHLFNYVAQPTLLALGVKEGPAINEHMAWLTSLFLVGWGVGGILFGRLADQLGRSRVLLITMALYGGGTAACAFCHSLEGFVLCRVVASLGIGGEWAAGASLLSEVAPDRLRPLLGALMYTASPVGQIGASAVSRWVAAGSPDGWRHAFLLGLAPVVVALVLRLFVAEPARWNEHKHERASASVLFGADLRRSTLTGLVLASVALVGAWGVLGFLPKVLREWFKAFPDVEARVDGGNHYALAGGLAGTLATVGIVKLLGQRAAFALYFGGAVASSWLVLGMELPLEQRVPALFLLGFCAHGVFGIFPYYLPELFPTALRGAGSGFCYNFGRFLSAGGVFAVGSLQHQRGLPGAMLVMSSVYLVGLAAVPFARETRGKLAA